jgi:hypothetical protein
VPHARANGQARDGHRSRCDAGGYAGTTARGASVCNTAPDTRTGSASTSFEVRAGQTPARI